MNATVEWMAQSFDYAVPALAFIATVIAVLIKWVTAEKHVRLFGWVAILIGLCALLWSVGNVLHKQHRQARERSVARNLIVRGLTCLAFAPTEVEESNPGNVTIKGLGDAWMQMSFGHTTLTNVLLRYGSVLKQDEVKAIEDLVFADETKNVLGNGFLAMMNYPHGPFHLSEKIKDLNASAARLATEFAQCEQAD